MVKARLERTLRDIADSKEVTDKNGEPISFQRISKIEKGGSQKARWIWQSVAEWADNERQSRIDMMKERAARVSQGELANTLPGCARVGGTTPLPEPEHDPAAEFGKQMFDDTEGTFYLASSRFEAAHVTSGQGCIRLRTASVIGRISSKSFPATTELDDLARAYQRMAARPEAMKREAEHLADKFSEWVQLPSLTVLWEPRLPRAAFATPLQGYLSCRRPIETCISGQSGR